MALTVVSDDITPVFDLASSSALVVLPLVGALIASRRPGNAIGWLFCGAGLLLAVAGATYGYAAYALVVDPGLPGAVASAWLTSWIFLPAVFGIPSLLFLLFPDGRPLSPRLVASRRTHRRRSDLPGRCRGARGRPHGGRAGSRRRQPGGGVRFAGHGPGTGGMDVGPGRHRPGHVLTRAAVPPQRRLRTAPAALGRVLRRALRRCLSGQRRTLPDRVRRPGSALDPGRVQHDPRRGRRSRSCGTGCTASTS